MDTGKGFLASRTVWANLIGLGALALGWWGADTRGWDINALTDAAVQVVAGLSFIASTIFRVQATRRIGP